MHAPTYDQLAFELLLADLPEAERARRLRLLAEHAVDRWPCPECGSTEAHEPAGDHETALCYECGNVVLIPGVDLGREDR